MHTFHQSNLANIVYWPISSWTSSFAIFITSGFINRYEGLLTRKLQPPTKLNPSFRSVIVEHFSVILERFSVMLVSICAYFSI